MPGYLSSLRLEGHVDGAATPVIEPVSASYIRVDAANGFAQPALAEAEPAIEAALAETGLALVAMRDSHHFSALWPDIEQYARRGYFALTMVAAGIPYVAPRGLTQPVFSTNPFAFASPSAGSDPVVVDFATSVMSHGDVQLARDAGRQVPIGVGTDGAGNDTTDPHEILTEGNLLPFGEHKGAALSMMIELLAAGLTGGKFSYEHAGEKPAGAATSRTGQLLIVVDPAAGNNDAFAHRASALFDVLRNSGMDRLPGDKRYATRARSLRDGVLITPTIEALFA
ncbi:delta1-piperideine-2-carboxylate reductase [Leucobacter exalbidus]|uniref:Delta1-piperideine-2-carboxylate reductase n=1 Tax=Leucobacter exalbidus TaxID=662960 RepID=A0A940T442_9MICO|nr:delta1-piperideine-2-carboxylate reductase [Leucobacter exalbidus]